MIANDLYKSTQKDHPRSRGETTDNGNSYNVAIPGTTVYVSSSQSEIHDGLIPSRTIKQSDNPLYSSTQELRFCTTNSGDPMLSGNCQNNLRTLPPRASDHIIITDHKDVNSNDITMQVKETPMKKKRLSYGLELEMSNCEILSVAAVHHQRSLSQGIEPVYTEL